MGRDYYLDRSKFHLATSASAYFSDLEENFKRAAQIQPVKDYWIEVAGIIFHLRFAGSALVPAVMPALAHLPTDVLPGPTITFHLWDSASTGVVPPRPPFGASDYDHYGKRAVNHHEFVSIMHAPAEQIVCAYDKQTRHAFFWTADAANMSIYERAAPLQTLFHWALAEFGWQIVHAAGLGTEAGGVLLIGSSGAGKSTTTLACLQSQILHFLSDDKCLVNLQPYPRALSLYNSAKIKSDMVEHLEKFNPYYEECDDTLKGRKCLLYLHPHFLTQMVAEFPIKAILIAKITNTPSPLMTTISPNQVLKILGPSTMIWLPGSEARSLHFIASLAQRLPCYTLHLANTPSDNLDLIADTLQAHI